MDEKQPISHIIGFDDGPFQRNHRGDVLVVGAVFSKLRLEGVLSGKVRRDGLNATATLIRLISESRFRPQLHAILLQGIALAGFNVIDLQGLYQALQIPVIVVSRKQPDLKAIKQALLEKVPGGQRKWKLIEKAGPMEPLAEVYVQRLGIDRETVVKLIHRFAVHSKLPEPLRTAHLIAGGICLGESRHRA